MACFTVLRGVVNLQAGLRCYRKNPVSRDVFLSAVSQSSCGTREELKWHR